MSCEDDVMKYLLKRKSPVSKKEVEERFKKMSDIILGNAVVMAKRKVEYQLVGSPSTILRTELYFLPPAWLESVGERKIPKETAKGICILKTMNQDIYPDVCYEHCTSFGSCAPDIKEYFKNNGLEWDYDESRINQSRLKRVMKNVGTYLILER